VLQEMVAGFEVRCCALLLLHEARRGVHSCVQAAAVARVAGGRNILFSAEEGDGVSVLCHVIADADAVNKQDRHWSKDYR
jgi:hypothetical protein